MICNCLRAPNRVAYADDLFLYKPVDSNADYNRVLEDLTTIDHWMSRNSLTLNTAKCKQMVITRSRTHQCLQLYLASQLLDCVQSFKYLGVIITSNLSWSERIQSICNKSRKLVGLLYRQLYQNGDSDTLRQFYQSCIRPHLEYAYTVWDPYSAKESTLLEACKSLPAKYAIRTGICTMRACWVI